MYKTGAIRSLFRFFERNIKKSVLVGNLTEPRQTNRLATMDGSQDQTHFLPRHSFH